VSLRFEQDDSGEDFFALTTYRQNGAPVTTPVWMAPGGDHWYIYTAGRSGKVRRIRREERVQLAPSDFHGEPTGAAWQARARIMPDSDRATATSALAAKYGAKFRFFMLVSWLGRWRKRGGPAVCLEITPTDGTAGTDRSAGF